MLRVREYNEKDIPHILRLHRLAMEEIGAYKGDGPRDDDLRNIAASYNDGLFIVGELENKLVAMGAIRKIDNLETLDKQIAAHLLYKKAGFSEFKKEIIDGFNCTWYELRV
jgi:hypothetical protein